MQSGVTHYPSDVTDEQWQAIQPDLVLIQENAPQRKYPIRQLFNAVLWIVKTGATWRMIPQDFPAWPAVYQQYRRWLAAGCFETIAAKLRVSLRVRAHRKREPSVAILDSHFIASTPESGHRAQYNGFKKIKGSKAHLAVDTQGYPLALVITPANVNDREPVAQLAQSIQQITGASVVTALADQGYTGPYAARDALQQGITLHIVKPDPENPAKFSAPKRWIIERCFAWLMRFRRLLRDFERLTEVLIGMHQIAFISLMLRRLGRTLQSA